MAQKCIQWWRFVNMVTNSRVSETVRSFINSVTTVSFPTRTETTLFPNFNWYLKTTVAFVQLQRVLSAFAKQAIKKETRGAQPLLKTLQSLSWSRTYAPFMDLYRVHNGLRLCAVLSQFHHFTFIFYFKVIQPSTPRPRYCLLFSGFPPGTVCAISTSHARAIPRPSLSFDGSGKSTHETPRYEIVSIPVSTLHLLKLSIQYSARMASSTRTNSLSTLSTGGAGSDVQGDGLVCTTPGF